MNTIHFSPTTKLLSLLMLSLYISGSKYNRNEKNYIKTTFNLKYNSFNKQKPIQVHYFDIAFVREFEMAKLGFKNLRCANSDLMEYLLEHLNLISNKMPIDLRIQMEFHLVYNVRPLLTFEIELDQVDIEVVSRVLIFRYEKAYDLFNVKADRMLGFPDHHCEVSPLKDSVHAFKFKIVMGDVMGLKNYYQEDNKLRKNKELG